MCQAQQRAGIVSCWRHIRSPVVKQARLGDAALRIRCVAAPRQAQFCDGAGPASAHFIALVLYQIFGSDAPWIDIAPAILSGPTTPRNTCFPVAPSISTLKSSPTIVPLTLPAMPSYVAVPVISVPLCFRSNSTWAVGFSCSMFHLPLTSHFAHSALTGEGESVKRATINVASPVVADFNVAPVLIILISPRQFPHLHDFQVAAFHTLARAQGLMVPAIVGRAGDEPVAAIVGEDKSVSFKATQNSLRGFGKFGDVVIRLQSHAQAHRRQ